MANEKHTALDKTSSNKLTAQVAHIDESNYEESQIQAKIKYWSEQHARQDKIRGLPELIASLQQLSQKPNLSMPEQNAVALILEQQVFNQGLDPDIDKALAALNINHTGDPLQNPEFRIRMLLHGKSLTNKMKDAVVLILWRQYAITGSFNFDKAVAALRPSQLNHQQEKLTVSQAKRGNKCFSFFGLPRRTGYHLLDTKKASSHGNTHALK